MRAIKGDDVYKLLQHNDMRVCQAAAGSFNFITMPGRCGKSMQIYAKKEIEVGPTPPIAASFASAAGCARAWVEFAFKYSECNKP